MKTDAMKLVTFRLGQDMFAAEISFVERVLRYVVPAAVPESAATASGFEPPPHAAQRLATASRPTSFLTSVLLDPRQRGSEPYSFQTQNWSTATRIVLKTTHQPDLPIPNARTLPTAGV